jgi:NADPH-dependent glutamate synthase beta subunit-like oxidoreductase/formate hydrogenlyase subunit 6/NADH:ubiquinone oxidoreductase subunit I
MKHFRTVPGHLFIRVSIPEKVRSNHMFQSIQAILLMGTLGLLIGAALAAASKLFYVYVDPLILEVDEALPGANCGGCGLPGCTANAEAIVAGKAEANSCVAGGSELAETIANIMGVTVEAKEPDIALSGCSYGFHEADLKYNYNGIGDCRAAALMSGGMKVCNIGCLGLGTCARACPFDAIVMGSDGLPVVNEQRCTGCGTCERVCPKHIITLSSVTRRIIREYTTEDCTTPCQRACPAGIDICKYISEISLGDFDKAVQTIKERNPFPSVIGRICPRPCETECRRNLIDEPVAINFLKRFAADYEKENGNRILPYKAPDTGRKVAIVGGGVEGLSAAFFSARLGHAPTVFEETGQLGGLLRSAIATNRLRQEILDWDIEGIRQMGVKTETGKILGKDVSIETLLNEGFKAVFLATGGWDNRLSRRAAADVETPIPGIYLLIDLIRTWENADEKETAPHGTGQKISIDRDVVISGGGSLALEAVEICRKQGADSITVLIRNAEDNHPFEASELNRLKENGAEIVFNAGIKRLSGEEGALRQIEYADLSTGEKTAVPAGTLFFASGRFPELVFIKFQEEDPAADESENRPLKWEGIQARKPTAALKDSGLFSDMDPITDFSAAIRAISAGRRGAATIHQTMYGIETKVPENVVTDESMVQNVSSIRYVRPDPRRIMPMGTGSDEELEKGFSKGMAVEEANRCLKCGLICYKQAAPDAVQVASVPG